MAAPVLEIQNLSVRFAAQPDDVVAVRDFTMQLSPGETLAIVGESGSGKSQAMLAALGLLAENGAATGSVKLEGVELLNLKPAALNRFRGRRVTMIFQEPMSALDPLFRVGQQIAAPLRAHAGMSARAARARAAALLREVGIADADRRIDSYPHQLSGGQRQRVMIAMAIANNPAVLIADEPTTALDAASQREILELLGALKARHGMAIVFITHDLGLMRRFADAVLVMRAGEVVEHGPTATVFASPRHPYTRLLMDAMPATKAEREKSLAPPLLEARGLGVTFRLPGRLFERSQPLHAVRDVDLRVAHGETLGILGDSGSGKTTLGRALLKLAPFTGALAYMGRDISRLSRAQMRPLRKTMQIVFQDPYGSLSPRLRVSDIVSEGLRVHAPTLTPCERAAEAAAALADVGIDPALGARYPHELSGGQRQRVAIARALILNPQLVVLDEPTSALDRAVQRDIVALLRRLQSKYGLAYVFISHDLSVMWALADYVLVMQGGRVVEQGAAREVFANPQHEATRRLLAAAQRDTRGPTLP